MSEMQTGTATKTDAPASVPFDLQGFLQANQKASESFTRGSAELGSEVMRFAGERLRRDVDTWQAVADCRTPADLLEIELGYTRTMMTDYMKEACTLMDMATKVGTDSLQVLDEHARSLMRR